MQIPVGRLPFAGVCRCISISLVLDLSILRENVHMQMHMYIQNAHADGDDRATDVFHGIIQRLSLVDIYFKFSNHLYIFVVGRKSVRVRK